MNIAYLYSLIQLTCLWCCNVIWCRLHGLYTPLLKLVSSFLKKGNFWLNLGILNFNNIHVHVIGFGKDIIVLFRYNHLQFHQFSYFCSFFGFSLILTKYIGGIYLTISDFLQTLKHRNFTFLFKGTWTSKDVN